MSMSKKIEAVISAMPGNIGALLYEVASDPSFESVHRRFCAFGTDTDTVEIIATDNHRCLVVTVSKETADSWGVPVKQTLKFIVDNNAAHERVTPVFYSDDAQDIAPFLDYKKLSEAKQIHAPVQIGSLCDGSLRINQPTEMYIWIRYIPESEDIKWTITSGTYRGGPYYLFEYDHEAANVKLYIRGCVKELDS